MTVFVATILVLICFHDFTTARSPPILNELVKRSSPICYPTRNSILYTDCMIAFRQMGFDTTLRIFGSVENTTIEPPETPASREFTNGENFSIQYRFHVAETCRNQLVAVCSWTACQGMCSSFQRGGTSRGQLGKLSLDACTGGQTQRRVSFSSVS